MTEVGYWRAVAEWSLGGNDEVGDCVFCTAANYTDLLETVRGTPQTVPDAEVERWYAWETGWTRANPASDKGEVLEKMLQHWRDNGNPSDPLDRITDFYTVTDISSAIEEYGAVFAWCLLPMRDDDPDLSDGALQAGTPGTAAHAVLIVGDDTGKMWLATWGEVREISEDWWRAYGQHQNQYVVVHPAWHRPA